MAAPELKSLVIEPGADRRLPFDLAEMTTAEQSLTRRVPVEPGGIDVRATVARSVARPGEYAEVPAYRMAGPDHLVLVDRGDEGDHRARIADLLVARLEARGVPVRSLRLRGRPARICAPRDDPSALTTLADLAASAPAGQRLLIFSDGDGLIDPRNGKPESWLDDLRAWPERVLLTPDPPSHAGFARRFAPARGVEGGPAQPARSGRVRAERRPVVRSAAADRPGSRAAAAAAA